MSAEREAGHRQTWSSFWDESPQEVADQRDTLAAQADSRSNSTAVLASVVAVLAVFLALTAVLLWTRAEPNGAWGSFAEWFAGVATALALVFASIQLLAVRRQNDLMIVEQRMMRGEMQLTRRAIEVAEAELQIASNALEASRLTNEQALAFEAAGRETEQKRAQIAAADRVRSLYCTAQSRGRASGMRMWDLYVKTSWSGPLELSTLRIRPSRLRFAATLSAPQEFLRTTPLSIPHDGVGLLADVSADVDTDEDLVELEAEAAIDLFIFGFTMAYRGVNNNGHPEFGVNRVVALEGPVV